MSGQTLSQTLTAFTTAANTSGGTPVPTWVALMVVIGALAAMGFAITMLIRRWRK